MVTYFTDASTLCGKDKVLLISGPFETTTSKCKAADCKELECIHTHYFSNHSGRLHTGRLRGFCLHHAAMAYPYVPLMQFEQRMLAVEFHNPPYVTTDNYCKALRCYNKECIHQFKNYSPSFGPVTYTMTGWCLQHTNIACPCSLVDTKHCSSCRSASEAHRKLFW